MPPVGHESPKGPSQRRFRPVQSTHRLECVARKGDGRQQSDGGPRRTSRDFIRGALGSLVGASDGFGPRIAEETKNGSYTFLRVQLVDGHRQALFRMITGMGALNYHGYMFDGPTAGSLRAVDCYVFLTGEPLSATLHRSFLPLVALDRNGVDHVPAADKDVVTYASQLSNIAKLSRDKKYAEVLDAYKHLPPAMQKSKNALALRLIAAQSVSEDQYLQAIDDFRKDFPNDAMIDLISLDGYLLRKSFDQALEALNHIDKAVGGDPYLKTMRAVVLNMQGKTDLAYRFAKEASAEEPTLPNNHFFLINLALKRRDFATTLAELQTLESKCGARFKDLTDRAGVCRVRQIAPVSNLAGLALRQTLKGRGSRDESAREQSVQ